MRWLCGRFKYSETAAIRRVQSARLLHSVASVDQKIQTGEVNLTTLAKAQSTIRMEEKRTREKISNQRKTTVVDDISHCTQSQSEKKLAELFPETMAQVKRQQIRQVADDEVRMSLTFKQESYQNILRAQRELGHALPEADLAQVIGHVVVEFLKRKRTGSNGISASVRRAVFKRDKGECQFRGCGSRIRVEIDHIHPRALGGSDDIENLRCVCRAHNAFRAEQTFGNMRHR